MGIPVRTPCPISERWHTMDTVPSSPIATKTSGSSTQPWGIPSAPYFGGSAARASDGKPAARTKPPSAVTPWRKRRRLTLAMTRGRSRETSPAGPGSGSRGLTSSLPAAPADVTGHGFVDLRVGGLAVALEERGGRHELSRLTVTTLRYAHLHPGRLQRPPNLVGLDSLDGHDLRVGHRGDRRGAGAHGLAVDVHGARAAEGHAAAELGARHPKLVAQRPQQRGVVG